MTVIGVLVGQKKQVLERLLAVDLSEDERAELHSRLGKINLALKFLSH